MWLNIGALSAPKCRTLMLYCVVFLGVAVIPVLLIFNLVEAAKSSHSETASLLAHAHAGGITARLGEIAESSDLFRGNDSEGRSDGPRPKLARARSAQRADWAVLHPRNHELESDGPNPVFPRCLSCVSWWREPHSDALDQDEIEALFASGLPTALVRAWKSNVDGPDNRVLFAHATVGKAGSDELLFLSYPSSPIGDDFSVRDRPWHKAAMKETVGLTQYYHDYFTRQLSTTMYYKVEDDQGRSIAGIDLKAPAPLPALSVALMNLVVCLGAFIAFVWFYLTDRHPINAILAAFCLSVACTHLMLAVSEVSVLPVRPDVLILRVLSFVPGPTLLAIAALLILRRSAIGGLTPPTWRVAREVVPLRIRLCLYLVQAVLCAAGALGESRLPMVAVSAMSLVFFGIACLHLALREPFRDGIGRSARRKYFGLLTGLAFGAWGFSHQTLLWATYEGPLARVVHESFSAFMPEVLLGDYGSLTVLLSAKVGALLSAILAFGNETAMRRRDGVFSRLYLDKHGRVARTFRLQRDRVSLGEDFFSLIHPPEAACELAQYFKKEQKIRNYPCSVPRVSLDAAFLVGLDGFSSSSPLARVTLIPYEHERIVTNAAAAYGALAFAHVSEVVEQMPLRAESSADSSRIEAASDDCRRTLELMAGIVEQAKGAAPRPEFVFPLADFVELLCRYLDTDGCQSNRDDVPLTNVLIAAPAVELIAATTAKLSRLLAGADPVAAKIRNEHELYFSLVRIQISLENGRLSSNGAGSDGSLHSAFMPPDRLATDYAYHSIRRILRTFGGNLTSCYHGSGCLLEISLRTTAR